MAVGAVQLALLEFERPLTIEVLPRFVHQLRDLNYPSALVEVVKIETAEIVRFDFAVASSALPDS